jgi:E3 ubiquitin-protein ligase HECTD1
VTGNTKRRSWDDEFVLKRQFSALIPAFDPRPGRTNVHQTSDLEIPPPGAAEGAQGAEAVITTSSSPSSSGLSATGQQLQQQSIIQSMDVEADADLVPQPKLHLVLRGPCLPNIPDVEIELTDSDWTVFKAVQKLIQASAMGTRQEKLRRIWEPTYTLVYKELKDEAGAVVGPATGAMGDASGQRRLMDDELFLPDFDVNTQTSNTVGSCSVGDVLLLLRQLYVLSSRPPAPGEQSDVEQQQLQHQSHHSPTIFIPLEEFSSKKVTNKLTQQLSDPLVVSSGALPAWCEQLLTVCPILVPFETRQMYFHANAFGTSR